MAANCFPGKTAQGAGLNKQCVLAPYHEPGWMQISAFGLATKKPQGVGRAGLFFVLTERDGFNRNSEWPLMGITVSIGVVITPMLTVIGLLPVSWLCLCGEF
jgi:hypothetical protein